MAVVKKIVCSNSVTVHIHDDFYSGITEDEINRRICEMKELAQKIFINAEVRKINIDKNLLKP